MIGRTLGHYRVLDKLGAGGMGEVYRATDTRLGRDVALKVLPSEMAARPDRLERFQREAKALAALDHPGIVTVHSVEESAGVHFLTMQLVEGQPLDRLIPASGLPIPTIVDIAVALAEALGAAHDKGLVHRDLKPANIMITTDGRVKILDFGLAKLADSDGDAGDRTRSQGLTRDGAVMGTVPYMSPEQVTGRPVDYRSDLFSLGVILYEMAIGRRPFEGNSAAELASSILRDTPRPLAEARGELPGTIREFVNHCLAKDPADRPASARRLREAVQSGSGDSAPGATRTGGSSETLASIAVLPFVNRGGNPEEDYFSDGLSEELINALGMLRGVKVTARSSSFQFRGQERDVREIGRRLGVATILEGSVRVAKDRLRITVELVNCEDGYQVWSQRYDGEMKDVFDTQDEIVAKVVEALRVPLGLGRAEPAREQHAPDLEAYHLYLKGLHLRVNRLDLGGALACFQQAVERDSSFAAAHVGVAEARALLTAYGAFPPREGISTVRQSLERANALDGESAEGHYVEGLIALAFDWDSRTATKHLKCALELNPSHSPARMWSASSYAVQGRTEEAHEQLRIAQERDPLSSYVHAMTAGVYLALGEIEEACAAGLRAVEFEPDSLLAIWLCGLSLSGASRWEEALGLLERAVELGGELPTFLGLLGWAEAASGRRDRALRTRARLEALAARRYVSPLVLAWIASELGNAEEAREELTKAFDERAPLLFFVRWPYFRNLRQEPLMERLIRHIRAADGSVFTP